MTDSDRLDQHEDEQQFASFALGSNPDVPRFVADASIPVFLGVDFEIAFFATSPDFAGKAIGIRKSEGGRTGSMRLPAPSSGMYAEAARIRLNAPSAEQLTFALIQGLIRSGFTTAEEFRNIVDFSERVAANSSNNDLREEGEQSAADVGAQQ